MLTRTTLSISFKVALFVALFPLAAACRKRFYACANSYERAHSDPHIYPHLYV